MSYVFDSIQVNNFLLGYTHPIRQKVKVASLGNVNTATCAAGDYIDGYQLAEGDRLLLKCQTNAVENGVYSVQSSGPLYRTDDLYEGEPISGYHLVVEKGTVNASSTISCTNARGSDVCATDSLSFAKFVRADATTLTAGYGVSGNVASWQSGLLADSGLATSDISHAPAVINTGSNQYTLATTRGSSDQMLTTNGSGGTSWKRATEVGSNFAIISSSVNVNTTSTATIAYFCFDNSMYSGFQPTSVCTFWIDAPATAAIYVDVFDGTSVLGSITVPTTSGAGAYKFDFTKPSSDKLLETRSRLLSSNISGTPIYSLQYKF